MKFKPLAIIILVLAPHVILNSSEKQETTKKEPQRTSYVIRGGVFFAGLIATGLLAYQYGWSQTNFRHGISRVQKTILDLIKPDREFLSTYPKEKSNTSQTPLHGFQVFIKGRSSPMTYCCDIELDKGGFIQPESLIKAYAQKIKITGKEMITLVIGGKIVAQRMPDNTITGDPLHKNAFENWSIHAIHAQQ